MTSSIKWEPIEDLKAVREMVERIWSLPWIHLHDARLGSWQVLGARQPIDLYETKDGFVAEVDVPGLYADDLTVSVAGSKMTIAGSREKAQQAYLHRERPAGKFARVLSVPVGVDVDGIEARLRDGVLVVSMPKKAPQEAADVGLPEPVEPAPEPEAGAEPKPGE
jgi:HSP20 family protein